MRWSEIQSKSAVELQRQLKAQRELLRALRFKVAAGNHKDVREIRAARQAIARILTKLSMEQSQPESKQP